MSACRSCGEPILWLRHVRTGKLAALDEQPDPYGGTFLIDREAGRYWYPPYTAWARAGRTAGDPGEPPLHGFHSRNCAART